MGKKTNISRRKLKSQQNKFNKFLPYAIGVVIILGFLFLQRGVSEYGNCDPEFSPIVEDCIQIMKMGSFSTGYQELFALFTECKLV